MPGKYTEKLVLERPIQLIGMPLGSKRVIVENDSGGTISVQSDSVSIECMEIECSSLGTFAAVEVKQGSCHIERCKLYSGGSKGSAVRIARLGALPSMLHACTISSRGTGVHCTGNGLVRVLACNLSSNRTMAVCVDQNGESELTACVIKNNPSVGLTLAGSATARLFGCDFGMCGQDGIVIDDLACIFARQCTVRDSGGAGLLVHSTGEIQLEDSIFSGSGSFGLELTAPCEPRISGCTFCDSGIGGMLLRHQALPGLFLKCDVANNSGAGAVIENGAVLQRCIFHQNRHSGVLVRAGGRPKLMECDIHTNWGPGIEVRGQDTAPCVDACELHDGKHSGLLVSDFGGGVFQQCNIHRNHQSGVSIRDQGNPELSHCSIHDGLNAGVTVFEEGRGTFIQCVTANNSTLGFSISTGGDPSIIECEITDGTVEGVIGVFVYDAGRGHLQDCTIHGERDNVLVVSNSPSNLVDNVTFTECTS